MMNQRIALTLAVLVGAVVGGVSVGGLNAQSQNTSQRPRYFVITEQEITDQQRYNSEYAPKVTKTILDHQGRFVVRNDQITHLAGEPAPKRIVILGFDTMDQIKRWQNSEDYKNLQPIRDQLMKLKQFAVQTCPPSGQPAQAQAQPGATGQPQACPSN
jgi:uncharacterized protein (DUF1330 family)